MTKEEFIKKYGDDCPDCDNSGTKVGGNEATSPEPEQCQWCYDWPGSKFQLRQEILALLKEVAEKAFKTGENYASECYCGKCGYCTDDDAPTFEDYWKQLNNENKALL